MDTTRAGDGLGMVVSCLAIPKQRREQWEVGKPVYRVNTPKIFHYLLFPNLFKSWLAHLFQGNLALKGSVKLYFLL